MLVPFHDHVVAAARRDHETESRERLSLNGIWHFTADAAGRGRVRCRSRRLATAGGRATGHRHPGHAGTAGLALERVIFQPLRHKPVLSVVAASIALLIISNSLVGWLFGHEMLEFATPFGGAQPAQAQGQPPTMAAPRPQLDPQRLFGVLNDPFASQQNKQIAAALLQKQMTQ